MNNTENTIPVDIQRYIDLAFTYHAPHGDQSEKYETISATARLLAKIIAANCPQSAEMMYALHYLQMTTMCANASIAMHGE